MVCFLFCWIHWFQRLYQQFFNCILLFMLLELSQFSPFVPIHPASPTPSGNPPTIGHIHGSCIQVLWLLHLLYCTLHPHGYSITTYLHFLIPSPPHPFPHTLLPSGNHQNSLCSHGSICSCLHHLYFRFNC